MTTKKNRYRLSVSDKVSVPVAGVMNDGTATAKPFSFRLICTRLDTDEMKALQTTTGLTFESAIRKVATGWEEQDIVLDADTNKPADFCPEALEQMLRVPFLAGLAYRKFLEEIAAREKN